MVQRGTILTIVFAGVGGAEAFPLGGLAAGSFDLAGEEDALEREGGDEVPLGAALRLTMAAARSGDDDVVA